MIVRTVFRSLALVLAFLCLAAPASAQTSEAEFTAQMAERFRAAFVGRTVEVTEPLQLRVNLTPEPALVNVGRLYNFCASASADECERSVARFVSTSVEGLSDLNSPIAREQLRIVVRPTEYCDSIRPDGARDQPGPLLRPFIPGLCEVLMVDFPTRMRSANVEELRDLGLEPDAAWALALRQTLADLPDPPTLEGLGEGVILVSGFDYATSLMLDADGWRAAAAAYGDLVVAVPASDSVVVARRANLGEVADFQGVVFRQFETAERGITPTLYRWSPAGFVPLD